MTLLVRISHATTGYSKTAVVQAINPATGASSGERRTLHDGESCEIYVHSGVALRIDEGDPVDEVRHATHMTDEQILAEADRLRAQGVNVKPHRQEIGASDVGDLSSTIGA